MPASRAATGDNAVLENHALRLDSECWQGKSSGTIVLYRPKLRCESCNQQSNQRVGERVLVIMNKKGKRTLKDNQLLIMLVLFGLAFFLLKGRLFLVGDDVGLGTQGMEQSQSAEKGNGIFDIWKKYEDSQNRQRGEEKEPGQETTERVDEGKEEETPKEAVWQVVEEDYFDDALFIGDSRVVGLQDYGKLEDHATFYASTGLNIFRLLKAKIVTVEGQRKKISVEEALGQRSFGKIYLMVGVNELDIGTVERFEETYRQTIERIQELQPDAIIYIQSILRVTAKRAAKGDYVTNTGINERNDAIMKLADNEKVFYLDVNEAVCDESGGMNPQYTSDGVHLKVKYIPLWKEYLMSHAIVR